VSYGGREVLTGGASSAPVLIEVFDSLAGLEWLAIGTILGVVFTVVAAGSFLLGERLFPTASPQQGGYPSGEHRRRIEIRQYLGAIGEPFAEDHPLDSESVDFYLPERDIAVTFDPRVYYLLDSADTYVVLAEHEMPGFQLGRRLPFETPDLTAADDDLEAAFAVFGLSTDAASEDVTAAYRHKIKEVHPDHGGDRESFRRVREAYSAAKEHASRPDAG
jgi:hypothetical protein